MTRPLTAAEHQVEREWLLEHGRSAEEVERMQRGADGEMERLLVSWAAQAEQPWTDHACVDCVPDDPLYSLRSKTGWRCLFSCAS